MHNNIRFKRKCKSSRENAPLSSQQYEKHADRFLCRHVLQQLTVKITQYGYFCAVTYCGGEQWGQATALIWFSESQIMHQMGNMHGPAPQLSSIFIPGRGIRDDTQQVLAIGEMIKIFINTNPSRWGNPRPHPCCDRTQTPLKYDDQRWANRAVATWPCLWQTISAMSPFSCQVK